MVTRYRRQLRRMESERSWIIKRWLAVAAGCILFYGILIYLLF